MAVSRTGLRRICCGVRPAVCAAMVIVNVIRLSLMRLSVGYYAAIHNEWGDNIVNVVGLSLSVAISLYGVRHELFSRA